MNNGVDTKDYLTNSYFPFGMDMQWFAAEDEGRTEDPTEHKIRKAREEGKVAKSADLASSIVLLFSIITIGIMSTFIMENLMDMMTFFLSISTEADINFDHRIMPAFFSYFIKVSFPVFGVSFAAAFMGNVLQVGFFFSKKPIQPDFKKIVPNFAKFFKRAFFSGESLFNLVKSILKVSVIGFISYINIVIELEKLATIVYRPFLFSLGIIASIAFRIMVSSAVFLLLLSIPDYFFEKRKHKESLKMSKQEIKEERKMMEGDPLIRSRLKERMKDILTKNMIRNVPDADVIVTNPTHYAVGMEWKRESMAAPMVIAKGMDNLAFKIREVAKINDVPIVENKPLARALYAEIEIGDVIPEKYYEVMALIMSEVYRISGKEAV